MLNLLNNSKFKVMETFYITIQGDKQEVVSLLGMKMYLEHKYGKGWKGSMLTDAEVNKLQELKMNEGKGFYDYKPS